MGAVVLLERSSGMNAQLTPWSGCVAWVCGGLLLVYRGHMAGADVVMAFVTFPTDAGEPPLQLKAFSKVRLTPHSSER